MAWRVDDEESPAPTPPGACPLHGQDDTCDGRAAAEWGLFGKVLEQGRPQGAQVRREHLKVLLDFVNEHREDAHVRPISDADFEAVSRVVERLDAVLDGALRG